MPITESAIKRMRSDARKQQRNLIVRSELKTLFKKLTATVVQDPQKAKDEAKALVSKFDRAARKGIIPKEKANRKKARIALLLSKHPAK